MNKIENTLKVFLVGIDQYQGKFKLKGCIRDTNTMHNFLVEHCKNTSFNLDIRLLINEDATYEKVTTTFREHFTNIKAGDQALFYFSGHGSIMDAPREFWHNTPSHTLGTLVLYDSRFPEGYDLIDKELSYLIWEATRSTNILFTVITDCCFAGAKNIGGKNRAVYFPKPQRRWENFIGAKHYYLSSGGITVPTGRHIHLASCRHNELSKETFINGSIRGLFTYSLVSILKQENGNLSYRQIISSVKAKVRNHSFNQNPQIKSTFSQDEHMVFLENQRSSNSTSHLLFYNLNQQDGLSKGWLIDAGELQGLKQPHRKTTELWIQNNKNTISSISNPQKKQIQIKLDEVLTNHTKVKLPESFQLNREHAFQASLTGEVFFSSKITLSTKCTPKDYTSLKKEIATSPHLRLVQNWKKCDFLLYSKNRHYRIKCKDKKINKILNNFTFQSSNQLIKNLELITRWIWIKNISSPPTNKGLIQKLEFQFDEILEVSQSFREAKKVRKIPTFLTTAPTLKYWVNMQHPEQRECPLFRLKVKTHEFNSQNIWLSILYLGSDFSITNDLLPIQQISPGEEMWVNFFDYRQQISTNLIPLGINDFFLHNGIYETTEHFKILISTVEFSTNTLNQESISVKTGNNRSLNKKEDIKIDAEWASIDFAVKISF